MRNDFNFSNTENTTKEIMFTIIIPEGAAIPKDGQIYYDPETINISVGTPIQWVNEDPAMDNLFRHQMNGADGVFDSQILNIGVDKFNLLKQVILIIIVMDIHG